MKKLLGDKKDSWQVKVFLGGFMIIGSSANMIVAPTDQKELGLSSVILIVGAIGTFSGLKEGKVKILSKSKLPKKDK
ncbi:hypothetical protein D3C80_1782270 [compost metagenome]